MVTSIISSLHSFRLRPGNSHFFLALCWSGGLSVGSYLSIGGGESFLSWMRAAAFDSVSIIGLFSTVFLPFLLSAVSVYCQQCWLIYFLAFFRAFSFGFCASGVMCCFGSAGWLVCLLLLFSDLVTLPWLYSMFLRCLDGSGRVSKLEVGCIAALAFLVVTVDRCFISPFLASLL